MFGNHPNVGARLAREYRGSGWEMFADSTGPFAGKPRSNRFRI